MRRTFKPSESLGRNVEHYIFDAGDCNLVLIDSGVQQGVTLFAESPDGERHKGGIATQAERYGIKTSPVGTLHPVEEALVRERGLHPILKLDSADGQGMAATFVDACDMLKAYEQSPVPDTSPVASVTVSPKQALKGSGKTPAAEKKPAPATQSASPSPSFTVCDTYDFPSCRLSLVATKTLGANAGPVLLLCTDRPSAIRLIDRLDGRLERCGIKPNRKQRVDRKALEAEGLHCQVVLPGANRSGEESMRSTLKGILKQAEHDATDSPGLWREDEIGGDKPRRGSARTI